MASRMAATRACSTAAKPSSCSRVSPRTKSSTWALSCRSLLRALGSLRAVREASAEALAAVHSRGMLDHLRGIHDAWTVARYAEDPGQDRLWAGHVMIGSL